MGTLKANCETWLPGLGHFPCGLVYHGLPVRGTYMHDHAFMLYTVILKNISIYIYTFHTIPLNILCIDIYIYIQYHISLHL